jgi:hypothetical protein
MSRAGMMTSRLARLAAAAVLAATAIGLGPAGAPSPVRAAAPDLTLVTATSYEVLPDEGRVAVTVRITATNHLSNTVTRRYFFEEGFLEVLPGTSNFVLTAATGSPSVAVSSRSEDRILLRLRFGSQIAAGTSLDLTLTFDLVDPGGAPDRAVRIAPSLVLFQAWAFGSVETPGSSVEVRVPAGYSVVMGRGPLTGPTTDAAGWQVWSSGTLTTPLTFVADVAADRPGGYVDGHRSASVGEATAIVVFRAWPDDPAWRDRVSDLVVRGLPILAEDIGAPWPLEGPLTVTETLVRSTGGYAGIFDPQQALAQIGYTASPGVVLHEAAHAWFNGALVADRWIAEAFASLYAERAAARLGVEITSPELADIPTGEAFPLNAWGATGEAEPDEDAFGFAASLALAREIATLVGDDALRATWQAAAAGEPAYQPDTGPSGQPGSGQAGAGSGAESGAGSGADSGADSGAPPPDWRALLDLLEANADPAAAAELERLWRRWVVRPADAALLAQRTEARLAYAGAVDAAAPWRLPRPIRDAMRAWQYESAGQLIDAAAGVIRQRAAVAEAAAALGLTPPNALREAFEGPDGLVTAPAEAATELAALGQIEAAEAARIAQPGPMDRLGLLGVDPEARLAAARAGFQAGDQDVAIAEAAVAEAEWEAVPDVARGRLISATLLLAAVLLVAWLAGQRRRRQGDHAHRA